MNRYQELERLLDREDLTDEEFLIYNKELNDLQDDRNKRAAIQAQARAERLAEQEQEKELAFIESLTEEVVEKMYEATCLKYQDVNGMSFKSWYEQSLKYYTIDKNFVVHSRARSPNTVDSVACDSIGHAKYRILTLIKTKFNDHAVRGYDFAWEIDDEHKDIS